MAQYKVDMFHIHGITPGKEQEVIASVKAFLAAAARVRESQMDWHITDSQVCPGKKHVFSSCHGLSMIGDMKLLTDRIMDATVMVDPVAAEEFFTREQVSQGIEGLIPNRQVLLVAHEVGIGTISNDPVTVDTTLFAVFIPGTGTMPA